MPPAAGPSPVTDLKKMIGQVARAAGAGSIAIVAAPEQHAAILYDAEPGFVAAYPVLSSSALADGVVIAIAVNALASAIGAPDIDTKRGEESTVHMDSVPLQISTPGTPATIAAPVRSLWQTDSAAVRLRIPASWGLRATGAVAWMEDVVW